jgi:hypothetical protein
MGKVVAGSFEEIVKIILRRVRTGIPLHQMGTQPSVEELIEEARKRENSSTEILRLKLLCLESEYHGQNGRYSEAAKCLEMSWQSIWPSSATSLPESLSENCDRGLLRQKLWLALHYVNPINGSWTVLAWRYALEMIDTERDERFRPLFSLSPRR